LPGVVDPIDSFDAEFIMDPPSERMGASKDCVCKPVEESVGVGDVPGGDRWRSSFAGVVGAVSTRAGAPVDDAEEGADAASRSTAEKKAATGCGVGCGAGGWDIRFTPSAC
jgi:hypothetical protein